MAVELEHLQIDTRLTIDEFASAMGEYVIGYPSRFRLIRKSDVLSRISPYFDFSMEENAARRKWKYDDPKFDCTD